MQSRTTMYHNQNLIRGQTRATRRDVMSTVPANQRRYSRVIAIEAIPNSAIPPYRELVERLACGHQGANHGATLCALPPRPELAVVLVGKKRQCKTCSAVATQQAEQAWQGGVACVEQRSMPLD
jgi:hypothetical protein